MNQIFTCEKYVEEIDRNINCYGINQNGLTYLYTDLIYDAEHGLSLAGTIKELANQLQFSVLCDDALEHFCRSEQVCKDAIECDSTFLVSASNLNVTKNAFLLEFQKNREEMQETDRVTFATYALSFKKGERKELLDHDNYYEKKLDHLSSVLADFYNEDRIFNYSDFVKNLYKDEPLNEQMYLTHLAKINKPFIMFNCALCLIDENIDERNACDKKAYYANNLISQRTIDRKVLNDIKFDTAVSFSNEICFKGKHATRDFREIVNHQYACELLKNEFFPTISLDTLVELNANPKKFNLDYIEEISKDIMRNLKNDQNIVFSDSKEKLVEYAMKKTANFLNDEKHLNIRPKFESLLSEGKSRKVSWQHFAKNFL